MTTVPFLHAGSHRLSSSVSYTSLSLFSGFKKYTKHRMVSDRSRQCVLGSISEVAFSRRSPLRTHRRIRVWIPCVQWYSTGIKSLHIQPISAEPASRELGLPHTWCIGFVSIRNVGNGQPIARIINGIRLITLILQGRGGGDKKALMERFCKNGRHAAVVSMKRWNLKGQQWSTSVAFLTSRHSHYLTRTDPSTVLE